ncbi:MAG: hypothetical protein JST12_03075 [Armatimonadetes bacterium]|nr:hypothetical protein [Armatimonadota bacterium]MBS1700617.1 hypothetical protein [Armatimonadota bacterium]MBS1728899.1 hypothetical protein [Armatimonadota bacterium]
MVFAPFILAALAAQPSPSLDGWKFQRKYTAKDVASYHCELELPNSGGSFASDIETTVQEVTESGATVLYKALTMTANGNPPTDGLPTLTTPVGKSGMPDKATITNGEEFFIFLGAAGMTTSEDIAKDQVVKVHWQNEKKDIVFDGTGRLTSSDEKAGTVTVDWNLTLTPMSDPSGTMKVTSVYSTKDFSLKSSEGYIAQGQFKVKFTVKRKT